VLHQLDTHGCEWLGVGECGGWLTLASKALMSKGLMSKALMSKALILKACLSRLDSKVCHDVEGVECLMCGCVSACAVLCPHPCVVNLFPPPLHDVGWPKLWWA